MSGYVYTPLPIHLRNVRAKKKSLRQVEVTYGCHAYDAQRCAEKWTCFASNSQAGQQGVGLMRGPDLSRRSRREPFLESASVKNDNAENP